MGFRAELIGSTKMANHAYTLCDTSTPTKEDNSRMVIVIADGYLNLKAVDTIGNYPK